jgi:RNA exonuclease 1
LIAVVLTGLTPKATADAPVPPTEGSPEALATAQTTSDAQLVTLYASLPVRTAVVIFPGHSDPPRKASLNACEVAFESAIKSGEEGGEHGSIRVVEMTKRGFLFFGIK